MTVTSFSASFLQKTSVATNHLYQIMLNQKSLQNSKSGANFQGALTFTQRDLNGYSQPSRTTLFSLGI